MNASDLTDLLHRECVLIEAGRATVVEVQAFRENGNDLFAELKIVDGSEAQMNRIRKEGEPEIARWADISDKVGNVFTIFQARENVYRSIPWFLHFSSSYGGTRLLFLDDYVNKVRHRDGDGWDWQTLVEDALVLAMPRRR